MSEASPQVILRHVYGSKANQIDQFRLEDLTEITIGRDVGSSVSFQSAKDDVVSRKHAAIKVVSKDPLSFSLSDLNSSNGTRLNGKTITGTAEISPGDTIELGNGGPKFTFDVQPRPANLASRTRVMNTIEMATTRVLSDAAASTALVPNDDLLTPPPKVGVGKNTVQMMLTHERKKTSQTWMGALAAIVVLGVAGGGGMYWYLQRENVAQAAKLTAQTEDIRKKASEDLNKQMAAVNTAMGMSAQQVIGKFGNSTVMIDVRWRLYDKLTGKPIYQKVVSDNKKLYRAYVRMKNGDIVRWLTTEDNQRINDEISEVGQGSGFVINKSGYLLTNKHVAAGWMLPFAPTHDEVMIYNIADVKSGKIGRLSNEPQARKLKDWVPEQDGAYVFLPNRPETIANDFREFFGRNDILEARFPGSTLSINASLVRASTRADTALIKIDSPQDLNAIDLADYGANVKVGERVIVLGYPGVSTETTASFLTNEAGRVRVRREKIPEPTVTDGIISKVGTGVVRDGTTTVASTLDDAFQLSINTTGAGNSGGPVIDSAGKVIGIFTYGMTGRDGTRVTFAVPIKHGHDLLTPQKTQ